MRIAKLLSATAMSLALATAAQATDDNKAYIDQIGAANSALIDQTGGNNQAGRNSEFTRIRQQGDRNELTVDQSGDGNRAGATSGGLDQLGNENEMSITQSGDNNTLTNGTQFGSGGTSDSVNVLTVLQSSDDNEIGTVVQDYDGTYAASGDENRVSITQQTGAAQASVGAGDGLQPLFAPASGGNVVGKVEQKGNSNDTDILQDGTGNRVGTVQQGNFKQGNDSVAAFQSLNGSIDIDQVGDRNVVDYAEQNGSDNIISLSITGDDNGAGSLSGYAMNSGAGTSAAVQIGDTNEIDMTITNASGNQFGFMQMGDRNDAKGISITGDDNELGVMQMGDDNVLDLAAISGSRNNVGLSQNEDGNKASITVSGATSGDNEIWVSQTALDGSSPVSNNIAVTASGTFNNLNSTQNGYDNNAIVGAFGNNNTVTLTQDYDGNGGGGSNFASIDVKGSSNEFTVAQAGFNDANVKVHSSSNGVNGTSFRGVAAGRGATAGTISQTGGVGPVGRNTVFLDIQSGDSNVFGFVQDGQQNNVSGIISGGGMNHVAVAQMGDSNATTFTQNGTSNTLGVTQ